jgi:2-polyprenyl-3-methyl-5-hydroxy-6-metoxy-1,4-benzoquinol methylase
MQERLNKCPLCKSAHFLNHREIVDYPVSKEAFILCKCTNCQLLFTNPRPKEEEIGPYYNFPAYFSHEDKAKSLTQWIYQQVRNYNISKKVNFIRSLKKKGTLLDYGCGTGEFLVKAKNRGWKVKGIEPSIKAKELANLKLGNKVKESIDDLKKESSFDVITLFHVLEHIHDLRQTVKKILNHLQPNGYLIIAVPNHESWDGKHYGNLWAGWDVPRHLYHFNHDSINKFKDEFELELAGIKPMKFDSFYVSLLSEGYKNPNSGTITNYLKAIRNGLRSNNSAKKPGNYSSNIFIFQKK